MNEFRQALDAFLAGRIDLEALVVALRAAIERQPHLAPAHGGLIEGMARSGRLRAEVHARLTQVLRAAAPAVAGSRPAAGAAPAPPGAPPPAPTGAPAAPPDTTTLRASPAAPDPPPTPSVGALPPADRTTFRPAASPGGTSSSPPGGAPADRTQFRVPRPSAPAKPAPPVAPGAPPVAPPAAVSASPPAPPPGLPAVLESPAAEIAFPATGEPDRTKLRTPPAAAAAGSLADLVGGELAPLADAPAPSVPSTPDDSDPSRRSSPQTTGPRIPHTTGPVVTTGPSLRTGAAGAAGATGGTGASRSGTGASGRSSASSWGNLAQPGEEAAPIGPGTVLDGKYVLEEIIGQGGMGIVFRARDTLAEEAQDRNPYVAIKILNDEFKRHPESLRALQRESKKAQNLAHPNILTVYNFARDRSNVFMVMELLDGEPLDRFIKHHESGVPPKQALAILRNLVDALHYAHEKRVVHSDFKPANAYVTASGIVKVLDFGIARAAKIKTGVASAETLFDAGTLGALTPGYASLEMHEGLDPDPRDDIYALACVYYELLTGRHPFVKRADTPPPPDLKGLDEIWGKLRSGDKIPADCAAKWGLVPAPVPGLSRAQWRGILHGLAFRRDDRTPTAARFLEEVTPRKQPVAWWIGGGAAAVAIVIAIFLWLPGYLHGRQLADLQAALRAGNPESMPKALAALEALPPSERQTLLADPDVRTAILDNYFDRRIHGDVNPAKGRFDFKDARQAVEMANRLYTENTKVDGFDRYVTDSYKQLIIDLGNRFSTDLNKNWLIDEQNPQENATKVLAILAQVEPTHPNLKSQDLAGRFIKQTDIALEESNIKLADALVTAGLARFPDDPDLQSRKGRLERLSAGARAAAQARDLQARIAAALAQDNSLAAFDAQRANLLELRSLSASDVELARFVSALYQRLDREISVQLGRRAYAEAGKLLDAYAELAAAAYTTAKRAEIAAAQREFEDRIARLTAELKEAVNGGRLAPPAPRNALAIYADLQRSGADPSLLRDFTDQIAEGYLRQAREERLRSAWSEARKRVQAGLALKPTASLVELLGGESKEIDSAEEAAKTREGEQQRALLAQQKKLEDERLLAELDTRLKQPSPTVEWARTTLQLAQTLRDRDVKVPLVAEAPKRIEGLIDKQITTVYEKSGMQAAALFAERAEALSLDSRVFQAHVDALRALSDNQAKEKRAQLVTQLKAKIDASILAARFDDKSNRQLQETLQQLVSLAGEGDAYVVAARDRIAGAYVAAARAARSRNSLDDAQALVKLAESYAPKLPDIDGERRLIEDAKLKAQQQLQSKLAKGEVSHLEQNFLDLVNGDDFVAATNALKDLAAKIPGDKFVIEDGPRALALGYQRQAEGRLKAGNYSDATILLDKAVQLAPLSDERKRMDTLSKAYRGVAEYAKTLASAPQISTTAVKSYINGLDQTLGKDAAAAVRRQFDSILANRAAAAKDPTVAQNIGNWRQDIFGSGAPTSVGPERPRPPVMPVPPAEEPARPKAPETPKPETPQETARVPASVPRSGRQPCEERLAGHGRQGRGICADSLPNGESGPELVVVPAGGPIGRPLAVMRYEVTAREFAAYCTSSGKCTGAPIPASDLPVTNISRADAEAYALWLSNSTHGRYRLPTNDEWTYFASAPTDPGDSGPNCVMEVNGKQQKGFALLDANSGSANQWGLFNIVGNAQEWATAASGLVARGGSYKDKLSSCTAGYGVAHDGRPDRYTGFRLVRELM